MANLWRSISHTLAALTGNCSDFRRAWDSAASSGAERWVGEWRSVTNGHHGELLCVLRRMGTGIFEAKFHARYAKGLRVCYTTPLKATPIESGFRLEGESDLGGLAGGVYTYCGALTGERLHCAYACKYDNGVFELRQA